MRLFSSTAIEHMSPCDAAPNYLMGAIPLRAPGPPAAASWAWPRSDPLRIADLLHADKGNQAGDETPNTPAGLTSDPSVRSV